MGRKTPSATPIPAGPRPAGPRPAGPDEALVREQPAQTLEPASDAGWQDRRHGPDHTARTGNRVKAPPGRCR